MIFMNCDSYIYTGIAQDMHNGVINNANYGGGGSKPRPHLLILKSQVGFCIMSSFTHRLIVKCTYINYVS